MSNVQVLDVWSVGTVELTDAEATTVTGGLLPKPDFGDLWEAFKDIVSCWPEIKDGFADGWKAGS